MPTECNCATIPRGVHSGLAHTCTTFRTVLHPDVSVIFITSTRSCCPNAVTHKQRALYTIITLTTAGVAVAVGGIAGHDLLGWAKKTGEGLLANGHDTKL